MACRPLLKFLCMINWLHANLQKECGVGEGWQCRLQRVVREEEKEHCSALLDFYEKRLMPCADPDELLRLIGVTSTFTDLSAGL